MDLQINTSGFVPKNIKGHRWEFQEMVSLTGVKDSYIYPFFKCIKGDHGCIAYPARDLVENPFWIQPRHIENGWEFHMNGIWCQCTRGFDEWLRCVDLYWDQITKKITNVIYICGRVPSAFRLKVALILIKCAIWILGSKLRFEFETNE